MERGLLELDDDIAVFLGTLDDRDAKFFDELLSLDFDYDEFWEMWYGAIIGRAGDRRAGTVLEDLLDMVSIYTQDLKEVIASDMVDQEGHDDTLVVTLGENHGKSSVVLVPYLFHYIFENNTNSLSFPFPFPTDVQQRLKRTPPVLRLDEFDADVHDNEEIAASYVVSSVLQHAGYTPWKFTRVFMGFPFDRGRRGGR